MSLQILLFLFREQFVQNYEVVMKKFLPYFNSEKHDFKTRPGMALKHSPPPVGEPAVPGERPASVQTRTRRVLETSGYKPVPPTCGAACASLDSAGLLGL